MYLCICMYMYIMHVLCVCTTCMYHVLCTVCTTCATADITDSTTTCWSWCRCQSLLQQCQSVQCHVVPCTCTYTHVVHTVHVVHTHTCTYSTYTCTCTIYGISLKRGYSTKRGYLRNGNSLFKRKNAFNRCLFETD